MASDSTPIHYGVEGKKSLRKQIRQSLASMTENEIAQQSIAARETLLSLPEYKQARRISIFMSMPGREISTGEIVDDALRSGKEVFIPFIYKTPTDESHKVRKEVMDMLQLRSLEDRKSLKADKWGIPSIGSDTVDGRLNCFGGMGVTDGAMPEDRGDSLDVIVMPGLAFDLDLSRLGHGKAYYDTFLERCCYGGRKKPFLVGLALSEQILPVGQRLPTESWDWPVDAVVIGDGSVLKPRNKSTSR